MPIVKCKPTSPGRRFVEKVVNPDLYKGRPYAPLVESKKKEQVVVTITVILLLVISAVVISSYIVSLTLNVTKMVFQLLLSV